MEELYRQLYRIRCFEETVLENFPKGVFSGTTHTSLGQEANAVGVCAALEPRDIVFSSHRGHGHFIARGGSLHALFAELMGKPTGVSGGRGGSQQLHWENFYSSGIQGGIAPLAAGMALAEKEKGSGALVTVFLGDGTLGEGVLYEALNLASLWKLPVLFVLENNQIAQTTPVELGVAGSPAERFRAFGIPTRELDTSDVLEILPAAQKLAGELRDKKDPGAGPRALLLNTCRFGPHSKGDDTRPPGEVARLRLTRDPIRIHGARLTPEARTAIEAEVAAEVTLAFQQASRDPIHTA